MCSIQLLPSALICGQFVLHCLRKRSVILGNHGDILILQEIVELLTLRVRHVVDMNRNIVAKLSRNLFQRQLRSFGEEKVDDRNEEDAPHDDDQVVLPADLLHADWRGLEEDDGRGKLAEHGESHADGSDFCGEDLGHVQVHGRVAECTDIR